jgi:hypothetical protein
MTEKEKPKRTKDMKHNHPLTPHNNQDKNVPNVCHNPNPYISTPQKCQLFQHSSFSDAYEILAKVTMGT